MSSKLAKREANKTNLHTGNVSNGKIVGSTSIGANKSVSVLTAGKAIAATKKRKRPTSTTTKRPSTVFTQYVLGKPQWAYLHLSLLTSSTTEPELLDAPTARIHITSAFTQFLGEAGASIPVDIMYLAKRDVWIRVPYDDGKAAAAAAGGWVGSGGRIGWRVEGRAPWLPVLLGGGEHGKGGQDLFTFERSDNDTG